MAEPDMELGTPRQSAQQDRLNEIVVGWDGDDDPENPYNWPAWKTNANAAFLAMLNFVTPLASSICAPAVPQIMKEFNNSNEVLSAFVVSIYVLGFALGPLVFAPMSEVYGRSITYHICNAGFVAFIVGCALAPSLGSLIAFRLLSGIFGSCPITNGGGSIADMVPPEKRGLYMGLYSIGPLLGPIVGPVAGGFLTEAKGWRWVFWLIAIVGGFLTVAMVFFARETYGPVILQRKVNRLRHGKVAEDQQQLRSMLDSGLSPSEHFKRSIIRPLRLLVQSPISIICACYMALVYGYLYLMFASITIVFEENYGFSANNSGLAFLGLGVGSIIGIAVIGATSDREIKKQNGSKLLEAGGNQPEAASATEASKPEQRIRLVPIGGVLLPAGLFFYGWTIQYHVHWIVPIVAMAVIGTGNMIIFMALVLYLVDSFSSAYAASALAANTFVRSLGGALLPLAGLRLFNALGLVWGNSLLGFLAVAVIPIPFLLLRYGEQLRIRFEIEDL
ncbi:hypothetical protein Daus18300_012354 [Diaporthe australafricana]|uniref:Major facilitator superfamily (MFS) profile domain-containing protein n=1 Tax=Diaporthe australafricana TaxID=127596 RepID=A0ABR3W2X9_9PEZI